MYPRARRVCRVLAVLLWAAAAALAADPPLFREIDGILKDLSAITGWKVKHRVKAGVLSRDQFRNDVESKLKKDVKPEESRIETLLLRMFGLIPESFDLMKNTVDLLSEQTAAYYDFNRKRLYLLAEQGKEDQEEARIALVHELAHALADQQVSLGKFSRKGSPSDDAQTARQAVMEGQATWLMWAWESKRAGGPAEVTKAVLDANREYFEGGPDETKSSVYAETPLYIQQTLIFPYVEGLRFQDQIYRKLGKAGFTRVFTQPPASTQQILHPDVYFEGRKPVDTQPPKAPRNHKMLADGALGELDLTLLIRQYLGEKEAAEIAPELRGGSFLLTETRTGREPLLSWVTVWSSEEAARSFLNVYRVVLSKKWKNCEFQASPRDRLTGKGDKGPFEVTLAGKRVVALEGVR